MNAAGLIFSNIHDSTIPELTRMRTMASVPFGCRYRLVDFALSNIVNANITKVGIITHNNYQSLLEHLDNGQDWDLARCTGGIKILSPFITAYENASADRVYTSRLEALAAVMNFISGCNEEYMVLSDCDVICNIDIADVMDCHINSGADMTIVTKRISPVTYDLTPHIMLAETDISGKIIDFTEYTNRDGIKNELEVSMNIMVLKRLYLQNLVEDAIAHGYTSFEHDVIGKRLKEDKIIAYKYEGYFALVNSLESYFECSMEMLEPDSRGQLFGFEDRPILTRIRNLPPTKYTSESRVVNSLVADGCVIEGTVENSVIFRGVKIGRGTSVRNCILFEDTYVGAEAEINCVVTDKNVLIRDGRILSGHNSVPFFIGKGISV